MSVVKMIGKVFAVSIVINLIYLVIMGLLSAIAGTVGGDLRWLENNRMYILIVFSIFALIGYFFAGRRINNGKVQGKGAIMAILSWSIFIIILTAFEIIMRGIKPLGFNYDIYWNFALVPLESVLMYPLESFPVVVQWILDFVVKLLPSGLILAGYCTKKYF